MPDKSGHKPGYAQKAFSTDERRNKLRIVASPDGRDGGSGVGGGPSGPTGAGSSG